MLNGADAPSSVSDCPCRDVRGRFDSPDTRAVGDTARRPTANPPSGATYSIDPTLRREFQTLALRAVAQENARIDWHIDDHLLGSTSAEVPLMWPLRPGTHRIVARDRHGHSAETTISVR